MLRLLAFGSLALAASAVSAQSIESSPEYLRTKRQLQETLDFVRREEIRTAPMREQARQFAVEATTEKLALFKRACHEPDGYLTIMAMADEHDQNLLKATCELDQAHRRPRHR